MSKNRVKNQAPRNKLAAVDTFCRERSGLSVSKCTGKCHSVTKSWQCNPKIVRFLVFRSCRGQFRSQKILCFATQHSKFFPKLTGRQVGVGRCRAGCGKKTGINDCVNVRNDFIIYIKIFLQAKTTLFLGRLQAQQVTANVRIWWSFFQ
jgi:hypothetical protein